MGGCILRDPFPLLRGKKDFSQTLFYDKIGNNPCVNDILGYKTSENGEKCQSFLEPEVILPSLLFYTTNERLFI